MKKKFGLELVMLVFIFLFVGSDCFAQPSPGLYEVYDAKGGHMQVQDTFEISEDAGRNGKFFRSNELLKRWGLNPDSPIDLEEVNLGVGYGEPSLCGHFDVHTDDHEVTLVPHGRKETPFGHGMRHGILIIDEPPPAGSENGVKIIWSARPLRPDQANSSGNCKKLDEINHGGIAHARQ